MVFLVCLNFYPFFVHFQTLVNTSDIENPALSLTTEIIHPYPDGIRRFRLDEDDILKLSRTIFQSFNDPPLKERYESIKRINGPLYLLKTGQDISKWYRHTTLSLNGP